MRGEIQSRRLEDIHSEIQEAKINFAEAIDNLELTDEANYNLERSVLDCAIHISLITLELTLIERIIQGNDRNLNAHEV